MLWLNPVVLSDSQGTEMPGRKTTHTVIVCIKALDQPNLGPSSVEGGRNVHEGGGLHNLL